jgi:hypothetical protein
VAHSAPLLRDETCVVDECNGSDLMLSGVDVRVSGIVKQHLSLSELDKLSLLFELLFTRR